MKLLLVEDEKELRESLAEGLRFIGYAVDEAEDGAIGEELFWDNSYDLIILDINLPKIDGFELLKRIREKDRLVKIIMLTARVDIEDRVKGLDLGASDYLIKPFAFEELAARIRSLLRRRHIQENKLIETAGLTYDLESRTCLIGGQKTHLTGKELGILEYLLLNPGRFISQEELLEHVWEEADMEFSNAVRVHMSALRKKLKQALGKNIIKNELGRGYKIDEK